MPTILRPASRGKAVETLEIDVAAVHDVEGARLDRQQVEAITSCIFLCDMWIKQGMLPRRSSSVCSFTAPLRRRDLAQGNKLKQRSIAVESRA